MCARKQTRRSVSLNGAKHERLHAYCEAKQVSMSEFVEAAIDAAMARDEAPVKAICAHTLTGQCRGTVSIAACGRGACQFATARCAAHGGMNVARHARDNHRTRSPECKGDADTVRTERIANLPDHRIARALTPRTDPVPLKVPTTARVVARMTVAARAGVARPAVNDGRDDTVTATGEITLDNADNRRREGMQRLVADVTKPRRVPPPGAKGRPGAVAETQRAVRASEVKAAGALAETVRTIAPADEAARRAALVKAPRVELDADDKRAGVRVPAFDRAGDVRERVAVAKATVIVDGDHRGRVF